MTGPHKEVARGFAAVSVLAAIMLVGLLAWRRTRSPGVAVAAFVLAGLTPWGRTGSRAESVGVALGAVMYCYV